jgi:hypothetical protein
MPGLKRIKRPLPVINFQLTQNDTVTVLGNHKGAMGEGCTRVNDYHAPLMKFRRHAVAEHL